MRRLDHLLIVLGTLFYIVTGAAFSSELVADSFKSIVLNREYRLQVYLPDGYRETAGAYPVVYLLHGAGADEYEWTVKGSARETLDGLIRRGLIRPTIAVLPGNNQSWWSNGASEKAETAFMEELLPYIEQKYKVSRERSMRSIGGLSMGGYGTLIYSLKYPQLFAAAAPLSAAIFDDDAVVSAPDNSYDATLINPGNLQIGNGGATGTLGTGTVTDNGGRLLIVCRDRNYRVYIWVIRPLRSRNAGDDHEKGKNNE